jgi:hypothetical protein
MRFLRKSSKFVQILCMTRHCRFVAGTLASCHIMLAGRMIVQAKLDEPAFDCLVLDLRKTSQPPGVASTESETVFSRWR